MILFVDNIEGIKNLAKVKAKYRTIDRSITESLRDSMP